MNSKVLKTLRPVIPKNKYGDSIFSVLTFLLVHKRWPDLQSPKTFNEHVLKLKLSRKSHDPLLGYITDKEYFKAYVKAQIGEDYIIQTFKVEDSAGKISNENLPEECVIKPTHLSNAIIIKEGKLDNENFKAMEKWLKINHYSLGRERNYKYLQPKIIVEELLTGESGDIPKDYKIFCFKGEPRFIQVDMNRFSKRSRRFYDQNWNSLDFTILYEKGPVESKPRKLSEMMSIARKLSEGFKFVRIDLYITTKGIKVGEMTFFPENCQGRFIPEKADLEIGKFFENSEREFPVELFE